MTTASYLSSDGTTKTAKHGDEALTSLVRSQQLILDIHHQIAQRFMSAGVGADQMQAERTLKILFGTKDVDLAIFPPPFDADAPTNDPETMVVGVKSAVSSIAKNRSNNFGASRGDATLLHETHPEQVVGHLQVIMLREVDRVAAKENQMRWVDCAASLLALEHYAKAGNRRRATDPHQNFEDVTLLIVDPAHPRDGVKVYESNDDLIADGWFTAEALERAGVDIADHTLGGIATRLLARHRERFPHRHPCAGPSAATTRVPSRYPRSSTPGSGLVGIVGVSVLAGLVGTAWLRGQPIPRRRFGPAGTFF